MSPIIFFIIIPIIVGLWAQMKVKSTYGKYVQVPSRGRITGREAAQAVMESAGIHDVEIVECHGTLTDHYDPSKKRLALSQDNFQGSSLAALGVAAHEAGHAPPLYAQPPIFAARALRRRKEGEKRCRRGGLP